MLLGLRNQALKRLELCAGKLACTVLRRAVAGNSYCLSGVIKIKSTSIAIGATTQKL
jgi:hypothetical protein